MNILLFSLGAIGLAGFLLLRQKINTIETPYASLAAQADNPDVLIVGRFWDEKEPSYHRRFIIVGVTPNSFGDFDYLLLHTQDWPFGIRSKWEYLVNLLDNGERILNLNNVSTQLIPVRNEAGAIKSFKFMTALMVSPISDKEAHDA